MPREWRIQDLVWAYQFLQSNIRKEARGLKAWVMGTRSPRKSFIFPFREYFKHEYFKHPSTLLGLIDSSLKMLKEHQNQ